MKTDTLAVSVGNQKTVLHNNPYIDYFPIVAVCLLGAVVSYFIGENRYLQRIILLVFLWAAATSSFNIISGYGGQVVFGYMMFVGTGAYTTVLLFKYLAITPWIGMFVGAVAAAILAIFIGLPTLRLRSHYFAVATVAFPLIMAPIINHLGLEEVTIPFKGHGISFDAIYGYSFLRSHSGSLARNHINHRSKDGDDTVWLCAQGD